jgi:cell shape-determining protein MreC
VYVANTAVCLQSFLNIDLLNQNANKQQMTKKITNVNTHISSLTNVNTRISSLTNENTRISSLTNVNTRISSITNVNTRISSLTNAAQTTFDHIILYILCVTILHV